MRSAVLALLVVVVSIPAVAAPARGAIPAGCRVLGPRPTGNAPWTKAGTTGEGRPFEVTFTPARDEDASLLKVTVASKGKELLAFDRRWPDGAAWVSIPIPDLLRTKDMSEVRAIVEAELFGTFCQAAEPLVARALAPDAKLEWRPGKPVLPTAYAFERTVKNKAEWVAYRGLSEGEHAWDFAPVAGAEVASSDAFAAVPLGHAVALYDLKWDRHAIAFVADGRSTISGVQFPEPKRVVITVQKGEAERWFDLDLATGKVKPRK